MTGLAKYFTAAALASALTIPLATGVSAQPYYPVPA